MASCKSKVRTRVFDVFDDVYLRITDSAELDSYLAFVASRRKLDRSGFSGDDEDDVIVEFGKCLCLLVFKVCGVLKEIHG